MKEKMRGYIYVNLLLVALIALGFVLSGGVVLSKRSSSTTKSAELYKLVDKEADPSNPTLQLSTLDLTPCGLGGLDIALVIDRSGSVNPNLTSMTDDIKSFVSSFEGKSTQFSVTSFSDDSSIDQSFTENLELITGVGGAIDRIHLGGSTNWQGALIKAQTTLPNRSEIPDLIIFISDGEPNLYYDDTGRIAGPGHDFDQNSLDAAILIANSIKENGATILSIGISTTSTSLGKLYDISGRKEDGPGPILDIDRYVLLTSFASLGDALSKLTTSTCN